MSEKNGLTAEDVEEKAWWATLCVAEAQLREIMAANKKDILPRIMLGCGINVQVSLLDPNQEQKPEIEVVN